MIAPDFQTAGHACPIKGCSALLEPGIIMCRMHWPMVSPGLRAAMQGAAAMRLHKDLDGMLVIAQESITLQEAAAAAEAAMPKPAEQLGLFPVGGGL